MPRMGVRKESCFVEDFHSAMHAHAQRWRGRVAVSAGGGINSILGLEPLEGQRRDAG